VGGIGVPELQGDVDDFAAGVSEHPPRDVEAHPRDDVRERQALVSQATLERPGAQPHQLGDAMQIGVAVGEQRGDDLVHGAGDVVVLARFLPRRSRVCWI
jgi:hypothetical protein